MSNSAVLGQFLWHELLTTDPEAGARFYSKVLGWNHLPYEGDAGYTMLGNAQGPVGGARVVGKDPLADKVGPNWLTYVGVPDLTAAIAAVEGKGGRVIHPVTEVPAGGGRYAVIADPQGAVIGIYQPGGDMSGNSGDPMAAPVVWHELTGENVEAALQFYKDIFGWELLNTMPMGGDVGNYSLFGKGKTQMGGAFKRPAHLPPSWPRWLVYLSVPSITTATKAAQAAGGQLLNGPNQVPGGNWIVQLTDSHGVAVALHGPKEAAAAENPKAKAKTKAKTKAPAVKAKTKTKTKTQRKAKGNAAPKATAQGKRKSKATGKSKAKAAARGRAKSKRAVKAKSKVRAKSRKAPRRGK